MGGRRVELRIGFVFSIMWVKVNSKVIIKLNYIV